MSEVERNKPTSAGDPVEALLSRAAPRPAPPGDVEREVREAVRAEWRASTGQVRRQRRFRQYALAATVLVALALAFVSFELNTVDVVEVATIDKSFGPVYLTGEESELRELGDLNTIVAGQRLVSGADAGIGLAWGNGGSLRIAADTRIEFVSAERVFLQSGKVYFDSATSPADAGMPADVVLVVETPHGTVRHVGTQYMAEADAQSLSVSVREGAVRVEGRYHDEAATTGQQIRLTGSSSPAITNFAGYGEAWAWTETVAPARDLDGKTVFDFLSWVSRETGLELEFETAAEQLAKAEFLRGKVDTPPMDALRIWMLGVDLDWRIEDGVIYIGMVGRDRGA